MIYADYNGSAPLHQEVREYLSSRINQGPYANPNAIHSIGKKMLFGLEKCRRICANALGCEPNQIIFNSGSSEGISHVFHSILDQANPKDKKYIITSGIEHSAVVQACHYYAQKGFEVYKVKTLKNGQVDLKDFENFVKTHEGKIAMVSIMAANNETGVIQPWREISKICNAQGIPFFSDTTQYIGKIDFNFEESGMDFAVLSGHKIGALIGSGCILAKDPTKLSSFIFGGGQEQGKRGGTQNYIGAETMAVALDSFTKSKSHLNDLTDYRLKFEKDIKAKYPEAIIIGEEAPRLASTTLIALPGVHGQAVQIELEARDIFVTTSSACSDNEPETSKVLKSMGIDDSVGRGVVRISLCCGSKQEHYDSIRDALLEVYGKLKKIASF
jgi:cysteine desulfurase